MKDNTTDMIQGSSENNASANMSQPLNNGNQTLKVAHKLQAMLAAGAASQGMPIEQRFEFANEEIEEVVTRFESILQPVTIDLGAKQIVIQPRLIVEPMYLMGLAKDVVEQYGTLFGAFARCEWHEMLGAVETIEMTTDLHFCHGHAQIDKVNLRKN